MASINIQTPNEAQKNEWLVCSVQSVSFNNNSNFGTITVKGVVKSNFVTTLIVIHDIEALLRSEIVKSLKGYYKLQVINETDLSTLKTLYYGK